MSRFFCGNSEIKHRLERTAEFCYFAIKMMVDLAKAFNQGVGFAIGLLLLPFVFNLILAFGGAQYMDGSYTNTQPDMVEDVVNKARDAVSGDQNDR